MPSHLPDFLSCIIFFCQIAEYLTPISALSKEEVSSMRRHHQGGAIREDWNFRISVLGCNVLTSVHFAVCLWCCMDRNESSNWLDAIFLRVHSFSVRSIISKGNYACSHPLPQKWLDQFYKLSRETFAIYASVPIRKLVLTYYCHAKLSNCVFELIILVFLLNISAMNKHLRAFLFLDYSLILWAFLKYGS